MSKQKRMQILIEFDPPNGADFTDIRDFIVDWLESGGGSRHPDDPLFHSLGNVHVSKPITPWRDPARRKSRQVTVVDFRAAANGLPMNRKTEK